MIGYKAFKKDLVNKYGRKFELNKEYSYDSELVYGENGHGFHFAEHLEDTLRFFNPSNDIVICLIEAEGNIVESIGEDYYDCGKMFVAQKMIIKKILTRDDIYDYTKTLTEERMIKMLSLYPFDKCELTSLKEHLAKESMAKAMRTFLRYQTGSNDTFKRDRRYLRKEDSITR